MTLRKPPLRVTGKPLPPTCDHCKKPCSKGVVRTKDGTFCTPKHRDAARTLRRAVAEPEPVDIAGRIETALARIDPNTAPAVQTPALLDEDQSAIFTRWFAVKKPDTIRTYKEALKSFAVWARKRRLCGAGPDEAAVIAMLDRGNKKAKLLMQEWVDTMTADGAASASIRLRYAAIRSFCTVLGEIEFKLPSGGDAGYVPSASLPPEPARDYDEAAEKYAKIEPAYKAIVKMLTSLAKAKDAEGLRALRDLTMLQYARNMGLRRIEVVGADVSDIDFARLKVSMMRKGDRSPRKVPLPDFLVKPLQRWLKAREKLAGRSGPLFITLGAFARQRCGRMSRQSYSGMVSARVAEARELLDREGIEIAPHDFRRIFCTDVLDKFGARRGKEITGHKKEDTLNRYDIRAGAQHAEMANAVTEDKSPRGER